LSLVLWTGYPKGFSGINCHMTESHDEELEYESWGECKADEATLYECNMEI